MKKEGETSPLIAHSSGKKSEIFAQGCGFYKLFWLFFLGSAMGDLVETVFCRFASGYWMSRSSLVYGHFSIVWGAGIVLLTIMLHRYRDKSIRYIFVFGAVVGGAYEYICSVLTEIVFGTIFWDYSKVPFNLNGRTNLMFCICWGIASVIWIRYVYPFLSGLIEKIPRQFGVWITWILAVFMAFNMVISALALTRYSARYEGRAQETAIGYMLDEFFPNERMEKIYPKAVFTK